MVMKCLPVLGLVFVGAALVLGCGGGTGPNVIQGSTGGGSLNLEIDDWAASGVEGSHMAPTIITVLGEDPTTGAISLYFAGFRPTGGGSSTKMWQSALVLGSAPATGEVYQLVPPTTAAPAGGTGEMSLEEDDRYAYWTASQGTVTVDAVVGNQATFTVASAVMTPTDGAAIVSSTGTTPTSGAAVGPFQFNGQIVIADLTAICQCSD